LKDGRSYCGDGLSHILDFCVDGLPVGRKADADADAEPGRLDIAAPGTVNVTFDATALLDQHETDETRNLKKRRLDEKPYWHIERCRLDGSRDVPIEIVVNGNVVATRTLTADGSVKSFEVPVEISQSSWVAVRILPSVHTNPVFVHVDGKPVRANRRSAEWCVAAVKTCWQSKKNLIRESERAIAEEAYKKAEAIYAAIAAECVN